MKSGVHVLKQSLLQKRLFSSLLPWAIVYTVLWAVLSKNSGWLLGSLFILLALVTAWFIKLPFHTLAFNKLPGFFAWFLRQSLLGGWDVALRTFGSSASIRPDWVNHQVRSQNPLVRVLLSAISGLLPGTLAMKIENDQMQVHVLNIDQNWESSIRELEQQLEGLFPAGPEN